MVGDSPLAQRGLRQLIQDPQCLTSLGRAEGDVGAQPGHEDFGEAKARPTP